MDTNPYFRLAAGSQGGDVYVPCEKITSLGAGLTMFEFETGGFSIYAPAKPRSEIDRHRRVGQFIISPDDVVLRLEVDREAESLHWLRSRSSNSSMSEESSDESLRTLSWSGSRKIGRSRSLFRRRRPASVESSPRDTTENHHNWQPLTSRVDDALLRSEEISGRMDLSRMLCYATLYIYGCNFDDPTDLYSDGLWVVIDVADRLDTNKQVTLESKDATTMVMLTFRKHPIHGLELKHVSILFRDHPELTNYMQKVGLTGQQRN